ncbi:phage baseplate plug family protein [Megasphaera sueciensis]|uniref:phage baseplate plug family protein n=1 Tax=Megasphaera sueciensis TaxID=349094 RepID=UPI003D08C53A
MLSIIPLQAVPNKTFYVTGYVDNSNIILQLTLSYNELEECWMMDIADSEGSSILSAIPLIPAQNILEQYAYLGIGSMYLVPKQTVKEEWPSYTTLTSDWFLVWGDTNGDDV